MGADLSNVHYVEVSARTGAGVDAAFLEGACVRRAAGHGALLRVGLCSRKAWECALWQVVMS
jgi:hypothetical protein